MGSRPPCDPRLEHPSLAFLFLLLLQPLVGAGASLSYPCPYDTDSSQQPITTVTAPPLPEQFAVQVEATLVDLQQTSEAVLLYDLPNRRAAAVVTANNNTVTSIYDYAAGERLDIASNGSCSSFNISHTAFDVFAFTPLRRPGGAALLGSMEAFRLGPDQGKVLLGQTTVRGIPVQHWQSCQSSQVGDQGMAAYVIDFYVTAPGYVTASAEQGVPVRVVVNGTSAGVRPDGSTPRDFSHVYDFSFFRPGPPDDESLFQVPRGTVCNRTLTKAMPQLPDRFSLSMEVYVPNSTVPPYTERMLFDYDFRLIQTTRYAPRINGQQYGLTELTIIEDYANRVQYVVDAYDNNCTVSALPPDLSTSLQPLQPGGAITMRHGQQLLNFRDQSFRYQGQRRYRDMKVDVWADASQSGMVQEVYFLAGWPSERMRQRLTSHLGPDVDFSTMSILVGTYLINTTAVKGDSLGPMFKLMGSQAIRQWGDRWRPGEGGAGTHDPSLHSPGDLLRSTLRRRPGLLGWRMHLARATEKFINIFNYLPMHMDMSAFDVSPCHRKAASELYLFLATDGSYSEVVTSQRYSFLASAKAAIAAAAGVSSLRVTKINVWQDLNTARLNFFFSFLEPPPFTDSPSAGPAEDASRPPPPPPPQLSNQEALARLSKAVKEGLTIVVKHPLHQTPLHVIHDSLKSWKTLEELWTKMPAAMAGEGVAVAGGALGGEEALAALVHPPNTLQSVATASASAADGSYTRGQFGGMAFGMLLLGVLVGVGAVVVALWRFRPDIHLLLYQHGK